MRKTCPQEGTRYFHVYIDVITIKTVVIGICKIFAASLNTLLRLSTLSISARPPCRMNRL